MVTLMELSAALGSDLRPAGGGAPASRRLSGVHVSELQDPTPYLDGGELLLTTGMPLGDERSISAYVARLQAKGVHALGFGLGPWLADVPAGLKRACRDVELELLIVADKVPFQRISRAFWELAARSGKADLMGSLGTQTALARAAMRADATAAVVRGLAQELQGWAAYLPADSNSESYWPANVQPRLPQLRAETLRLNRTGVHSAATFEIDGGPVVEYPIADGDRILGFLAVGPGRRITAADRQIILTVCTLLAIKARERRAAASAAATLRSAVAKLLLTGRAEAARVLAAEAGLEDLPAQVRILAFHAEHDDDADSLIRQAAQLPRSAGLPALAPGPEGTALRFQEAGVMYQVIYQMEPVSHVVPEPQLSEETQPPVPGGDAAPSPLKAVLSEPVWLSEAAETVQMLRRALSRAPEGMLVAAADEGQHRADQWVAALAGYSGIDLLGTVASYLRHRGHWENVARELGLHRNSVRHRISIASALLGVNFDDADVAAPLWLALRRRNR